MHCALCSMHCALCSMHCALCSMHARGTYQLVSPGAYMCYVPCFHPSCSVLNLVQTGLFYNQCPNCSTVFQAEYSVSCVPCPVSGGGGVVQNMNSGKLRPGLHFSCFELHTEQFTLHTLKCVLALDNWAALIQAAFIIYSSAVNVHTTYQFWKVKYFLNITFIYTQF